MRSRAGVETELLGVHLELVVEGSRADNLTVEELFKSLDELMLTQHAIFIQIEEFENRIPLSKFIFIVKGVPAQPFAALIYWKLPMVFVALQSTLLEILVFIIPVDGS